MTHKHENQSRHKRSKSDLIAHILQEFAEVAKVQKEMVGRELIKVDNILKANNLKREVIRPYGNCFLRRLAEERDKPRLIIAGYSQT